MALEKFGDLAVDSFFNLRVKGNPHSTWMSLVHAIDINHVRNREQWAGRSFIRMLKTSESTAIIVAGQDAPIVEMRSEYITLVYDHHDPENYIGSRAELGLPPNVAPDCTCVPKDLRDGIFRSFRSNSQED